MKMRTLPIFFAFFVMGFVDAVGTLVGFAKEQFQLSGFMAGLLPFFGFIAFALFSVPGGVLMDKKGKKFLMLLSLAIVLVGQVVSAVGPDHEGPLVVYDFIAWPNGQFEFDRGAVVEGAPMAAEFNALLLEGCRRLDERRRGRPLEAPAV